MNYDELLADHARLDAEREVHFATREVVQAQIDAAIMKAAREATGRTLRSRQKAVEALNERGLFDGVVAPLSDPWNETLARLDGALEANRKARRDAARAAELSPVAMRTRWEKLDSVSATAYRSVGYGCDRYARAAAEDVAAAATRHGVETIVQEVRREVPGDLTPFDRFEVWVRVADTRDLQLLRDKPDETPVREWVRMCWKRGVNPRVYNPFLPHGYEEKHGLDFFGGERESAT